MKTNQKIIIFDAGTLISIGMASLLNTLKELKKIFKGKFIITNEIKYEVVDKPLNIKRFELEALKIKALFDEKILEMPSVLGILELELKKETEKILGIANKTFYSKGKPIKIIDRGEASCLALSKILTKKGIKNVIAIDERTTRILSEKPENLKKILEKKLHSGINVKKENYQFFKGPEFIRSCELVYVAYKKNLIKLKGPRVLDAVLYALKFKGCSISNEEIKEIKKLH